MKDTVERKKIVKNRGQQGVRFFDSQYRAQVGNGAVGDIKYLGKGGKGEMRAEIFAIQSPTGETLLKPEKPRKVKHTR